MSLEHWGQWRPHKILVCVIVCNLFACAYTFPCLVAAATLAAKQGRRFFNDSPFRRLDPKT